MSSDTPNEFDAETTRLYYETAKAELQLRLQLRDNAATMYLGTIAVVLALGLETMNALLFLVPLIALLGATMATHHNIAIGYFSWYCASVDDFLHRSGRKPMVAWDRSEAYQDYATRSRRFALGTHFLFFVMPTGVAIGSILCRQTVITDDWDGLLLVFDLFLAVALACLLIYANRRRKHCHEKIQGLYPADASARSPSS